MVPDDDVADVPVDETGFVGERPSSGIGSPRLEEDSLGDGVGGGIGRSVCLSDWRELLRGGGLIKIAGESMASAICASRCSWS